MNMSLHFKTLTILLGGIYSFVAVLQILRSNIEFITLFLLGKNCCEMEILTV